MKTQAPLEVHVPSAHSMASGAVSRRCRTVDRVSSHRPEEQGPGGVKARPDQQDQT